MRACNIGFSVPQVLKTLHGMFTMTDNLRVNLTMRQSPYTGVAAVTIIIEAMKAWPKSAAWNWADGNLTSEMVNFRTAGRAVVNDSFIGYAGVDHTEVVKNTLFPNL